MYNSRAIIMPRTWVKNVYSLRIVRGVYGGKTVFSYTPITQRAIHTWVKLSRYAQIPTIVLTILSTLKTVKLPLLKRYLYPLSTIPTITRTKENKERNS